MKSLIKIPIYFFFTIILFFYCLNSFADENKLSSSNIDEINLNTTAVKNEENYKKSSPADKNLSQKKPVLILKSIENLRKNLNKRIYEKRKKIEKSQSITEKNNLTIELKKLDELLEETAKDFERIATGIDTSLFSPKKEEPFDWKEELLSLIKPGIKEIKRLTLKTRQKANLKEQIYGYEELLPYAKEAIENISDLLGKKIDEDIKMELLQLLEEWKGINFQLENEKKVAELTLLQMQKKEKSFLEASQKSIANFFKTKGLFILIAFLLSFILAFLLGLFHKLLIKFIPGFSGEKKPFRVKAFELAFRFFTLVIILFSIIFVFYSAQDWTLLSITIIFILGVIWALKNTIPKLWMQSRLILNIGPVREGERILFHGIPWRVNAINFYTTVVNPDLGITLRIPIEDLIGMTSRPEIKNEPWFPCRRNDWVILSDGTRGKVVSLSHEMIELVMRGGAHKVYQTQDFLGLSPLNLSINFRLKTSFGLSYDLQADITKKIPEILTSYIKEKIKEEGYENILLNIKTEFEQAGGSSLDLVVISDFKGEAAPLYNRLRRATQKWCVEAATINNWDIPFPQLTVHKYQDSLF
ncbi:MAG: hypothetical protein CSA18_01710 [Deltaproteobacteria bacterium]|nr:MAG: hypothetical protein CSA18_01710 [Deltaproteobacteria bacterium]